jgi:hypothetical protein
MPKTADRVSKRKLTLAEAAEQWETAKREIDRCKPLLEEAAPVLLEHFERTRKATYRDRIAVTTTPSKLLLDQAKVREYLGQRLAEFQRRTEPSKSLSLLK